MNRTNPQGGELLAAAQRLAAEATGIQQPHGWPVATPAGMLDPDAKVLRGHPALSVAFGDAGARSLIAMFPGMSFRLDDSGRVLLEAAIGSLVTAAVWSRYAGWLVVVPVAVG